MGKQRFPRWPFACCLPQVSLPATLHSPSFLTLGFLLFLPFWPTKSVSTLLSRLLVLKLLCSANFLSKADADRTIVATACSVLATADTLQ